MSDGARRILLNASYRVAADVVAKIASVALYVVMARQLGSADFGVFAFGLSFVTLVTALADFGQDRILTREVARAHERVDSYFANTVALKLVLAVPALAVGIAILSATASPETRDVAALLGVAVVAEQLMATCFATFQSYERLVFIPAALVTQRLLMAAWGIAALLSGAGVLAVAGIYLASAFVGLAIAISLLLTRVVRPKGVGVVTPRTWRALMIAALPIGAAGVFSTVLFRADMAMLAAFESAEEVGEYAAAFRLFETTLFLSWGVGAAVYPVFSRLSLTSSPPVRLVFERALKLAVALTLPLAVGAAVLAAPLVELLYGAEFEDSAQALILLAPAIALYPFAYLSGYVLVSQDRQKVLAPVYAALAAENVLLNLLLIPAFSLYGAAAGSSISQALAGICLMVFAVRLLGRLEWVRMLGGAVVGSVLAGTAMALLYDQLAAAIVAGTVVYVAALLAFEWRAYPEDARALRALLPPNPPSP
jgi:O-antigen/teichoic acid export membrane protein